MAKKAVPVANGNAATVPASVWSQSDKDAPLLQDVLSQCGHFFEQLGYEKTLRTLVKEATDKHSLDVDVVGWGNGRTTLLSLWAEHHDEKKSYPTLIPSEVEVISSDSESDDGSDDDSDSDADMAEVKEAPTGEKRKRVLTPPSSEDSSSASDSSDSESEVDRPAKRNKLTETKVADAKADDSSEASSSSESEDSDADSTAAPVAAKETVKRVKKEISSDSPESESDSSSDSDSDEDSSAAPVTTKPEASMPSNTMTKTASSESSSSDSSSDSGSSDSDSEPPAPIKKPKSKKTDSKKVKLEPEEVSGGSSISSATLVADEETSTKKNKKAAKKVKKEAKTAEPVTATPSEEDNGGMHPDRMARLPNTPVTAQKGKKSNVPFSRIPADTKVDPRFSNNDYVSYEYADRAHQELIVTKGKGFTKEKNKKKRGMWSRPL